MKLRNAFSIPFEAYGMARIALLPTILELLKTPLHFFHLSDIRRIFMAHLWLLAGDGIDLNDRPQREALLTPNAYGVVMDVGAG